MGKTTQEEETGIMEDWKKGKRKDWNIGKLEEWKDGRTEQQKDGKMERQSTGRLEDGRNPIARSLTMRYIQEHGAFAICDLTAVEMRCLLARRRRATWPSSFTTSPFTTSG